MKQNTLRGKLLSFLVYIYPDSADELSVVGIFHEYHRDHDIRRALEYLVDSGYALKEESPHPYRFGEKVRMYKASPAGIDVDEGQAQNPSVTPQHEGD